MSKRQPWQLNISAKNKPFLKMEQLVKEESQKLLAKQMQEARIQRQIQVRQQALAFSDQKRKLYEQARERQIKKLAAHVTEEAQKTAMENIHRLHQLHDLAMADIGMAHRAAAGHQNVERLKSLKRLKNDEVAKNRGAQAAMKMSKERQQLSAKASEIRNRKKEVRMLEDMKSREIVSRRPLALTNPNVDRKPVIGPPEYQQSIAKTLSTADTSSEPERKSKASTKSTDKKPRTGSVDDRVPTAISSSTLIDMKDTNGLQERRQKKPRSFLEHMIRVKTTQPTSVSGEEYVRLLDANNRDEHFLSGVERRNKYTRGVLGTDEVINPYAHPSMAIQQGQEGVRYYDASVPNGEVKYVAPDGLAVRESRSSPDAWEKGRQLSEHLLREQEEKEKRQQELEERQRERSERAILGERLLREKMDLENQIRNIMDPTNLPLDIASQSGIFELQEDKGEDAKEAKPFSPDDFLPVGADEDYLFPPVIDSDVHQEAQKQTLRSYVVMTDSDKRSEKAIVTLKQKESESQSQLQRGSRESSSSSIGLVNSTTGIEDTSSSFPDAASELQKIIDRGKRPPPSTLPDGGSDMAEILPIDEIRSKSSKPKKQKYKSDEKPPSKSKSTKSKSKTRERSPPSHAPTKSKSGTDDNKPLSSSKPSKSTSKARDKSPSAHKSTKYKLASDDEQPSSSKPPKSKSGDKQLSSSKPTIKAKAGSDDKPSASSKVKKRPKSRSASLNQSIPHYEHAKGPFHSTPEGELRPKKLSIPDETSSSLNSSQGPHREIVGTPITKDEALRRILVKFLQRRPESLADLCQDASTVGSCLQVDSDFFHSHTETPSSKGTPSTDTDPNGSGSSRQGSISGAKAVVDGSMSKRRSSSMSENKRRVLTQTISKFLNMRPESIEKLPVAVTSGSDIEADTEFGSPNFVERTSSGSNMSSNGQHQFPLSTVNEGSEEEEESGSGSTYSTLAKSQAVIGPDSHNRSRSASISQSEGESLRGSSGEIEPHGLVRSNGRRSDSVIRPKDSSGKSNDSVLSSMNSVLRRVRKIDSGPPVSQSGGKVKNVDGMGTSDITTQSSDSRGKDRQLSKKYPSSYDKEERQQEVRETQRKRSGSTVSKEKSLLEKMEPTGVASQSGVFELPGHEMMDDDFLAVGADEDYLFPTTIDSDVHQEIKSQRSGSTSSRKRSEKAITSLKQIGKTASRDSKGFPSGSSDFRQSNSTAAEDTSSSFPDAASELQRIIDRGKRTPSSTTPSPTDKSDKITDGDRPPSSSKPATRLKSRSASLNQSTPHQEHAEGPFHSTPDGKLHPKKLSIPEDTCPGLESSTQGPHRETAGTPLTKDEALRRIMVKFLQRRPESLVDICEDASTVGSCLQVDSDFFQSHTGTPSSTDTNGSGSSRQGSKGPKDESMNMAGRRSSSMDDSKRRALAHYISKFLDRKPESIDKLPVTVSSGSVIEADSEYGSSTSVPRKSSGSGSDIGSNGQHLWPLSTVNECSENGSGSTYTTIAKSQAVVVATQDQSTSMSQSEGGSLSLHTSSGESDPFDVRRRSSSDPVIQLRISTTTSTSDTSLPNTETELRRITQRERGPPSDRPNSSGTSGSGPERETDRIELLEEMTPVRLWETPNGERTLRPESGSEDLSAIFDNLIGKWMNVKISPPPWYSDRH